jgi:hypothetical protein
MRDDISRHPTSAAASAAVPRPGRPTRVGWAAVVERPRANLPPGRRSDFFGSPGRLSLESLSFRGDKGDKGDE